MPFLDITSLDRFFANEDRESFGLSLHSASPATADNELTAASASGYERQDYTLTGSNDYTPPRLFNDADIVFGPAVDSWPEVHAIGLWGGPAPDTLLAYHELPAVERPAIEATHSYTVPENFAFLETPPRDTGSVGWHGGWERFVQVIRDREYWGVVLDAGGTHGGISSTDAAEVAKISGMRLDLTLYADNPIGTTIDVQQYLVRLTDVLFYWSPTAHALVNYFPVRIPTRIAGTARYFLLSTGTPHDDLVSVLYNQRIEPPLGMQTGRIYHYNARTIQAPLVHG